MNREVANARTTAAVHPPWVGASLWEDPTNAFPGEGRRKPEDAELTGSGGKS